MVYVPQLGEGRQEGAVLRKREPLRAGTPAATSTSLLVLSLLRLLSLLDQKVCLCPSLLTLPKMAHTALGESLGEISRTGIAFVQFQSGVKAIAVLRHVTFH